MVSGGGQSSSGSGSTGLTTSMSFVPALLANAFFGSGIGLNQGGFQMTGTKDFKRSGQMKSPKSSSLVDPFGLNQILNPVNQAGGWNLDPFTNITGGEDGGGGGSFLSDLFGGGGQGGGFEGLFGGGRRITQEQGMSPESLGQLGEGGEGGFAGTGGALNPFDLISNVMDLVDPGINPGVQGGMQSLMGGELGGMMGNSLLLGDIGPTLQEGLQTGFKPDLQPVIDEAMRGFFQDIVPQLGQSNVAMQEGVGPFSTDLNAALTGAGGTIASQLGSLEVENQNRAADRRGEMLGLSGLITDQLFNASTDAGRNRLDLGEQLAMMGTKGGRQSQLLQLLAGMTPSGPIQASSSQNNSKGGQGGFL